MQGTVKSGDGGNNQLHRHQEIQQEIWPSGSIWSNGAAVCRQCQCGVSTPPTSCGCWRPPAGSEPLRNGCSLSLIGGNGNFFTFELLPGGFHSLLTRGSPPPPPPPGSPCIVGGAVKGGMKGPIIWLTLLFVSNPFKRNSFSNKTQATERSGGLKPSLRTAPVGHFLRGW